MKSERLKKLENELKDLDQWLKLGLVPKKDLEKHKIEIEALKQRIEEEKARLLHIKESGDMEEYVAPKKQTRSTYHEPQSMPGMDLSEDGMTDAGLDMETEGYETESGFTEDGEETQEEKTEIEEEEEDPFSDRNRWKRGILEDPDRYEW